MCFGIVLEETKLSKPSSPLISFRFLINFFNKGNIIRGSYTMGTPRRIDVDISSIRRRPNFDDFPRHFRVLFRCYFDGRKIHVVSTYFFRCNFDGRSMHVVFTYFFRRNFDGRNNSDVSRINQIMSKLLILSKRLQFWTCRAFSHFTFHKPLEVFYYNW